MRLECAHFATFSYPVNSLPASLDWGYSCKTHTQTTTAHCYICRNRRSLHIQHSIHHTNNRKLAVLPTSSQSARLAIQQSIPHCQIKQPSSLYPVTLWSDDDSAVSHCSHHCIPQTNDVHGVNSELTTRTGVRLQRSVASFDTVKSSTRTWTFRHAWLDPVKILNDCATIRFWAFVRRHKFLFSKVAWGRAGRNRT